MTKDVARRIAWFCRRTPKAVINTCCKLTLSLATSDVERCVSRVEIAPCAYEALVGVEEALPGRVKAISASIMVG